MSVVALGLAMLRYSNRSTSMTSVFGTALGIWTADWASTVAQLYYHGDRAMKTLPSPIEMRVVRHPFVPWSTYTLNDGAVVFRTFNLPWVMKGKDERYTVKFNLKDSNKCESFSIGPKNPPVTPLEHLTAMTESSVEKIIVRQMENNSKE